ncbi:hypothetical protein CY34DRAFT_479507 [Suillus luteus UH-Slu-Lm8-n1]|uniref:Uncharacterized protein n=1 Tax=Suillus luteus UH-Slu-Lm8-n1 TaxID=930992 RepID=A0A0D0AFY0_9AGAM|nr:hypothetical protein CY34DRAFT_479507 [Suillus luteus UH-Slu-Lm8-n1]
MTMSLSSCRFSLSRDPRSSSSTRVSHPCQAVTSTDHKWPPKLVSYESMLDEFPW